MDKTLPGLSDVVYDELTEKLTKKQQNRLKLGASAILALEKDEKAKSGKRKQFSKQTKLLVLISQRNNCKSCGQSLTVVNFDHIDGNSSNNYITNCQALCPNCHAKKTRKRI